MKGLVLVCIVQFSNFINDQHLLENVTSVRESGRLGSILS